MAEIRHDFPIAVPASRVFDAVSSPKGLDAWWTLTSAGRPVAGSEYELGFGPEYQWRARVTSVVPNRAFELELTRSDADWNGTRVGFELEENDGTTQVRFRHTGWPQANEHHRISSFCWAMYLRIMKRHLENGESVPYADRLNV